MRASGAVIEALHEAIRARREAGEVWYVVYDRPIKATRDDEGNVSLRLTSKTKGTSLVSRRAREVFRKHPGLESGHFVHEPVEPVAIERDDRSRTTLAEVWAALDDLPQ